MEIEFDEEKRRWTLETRGLDFLDTPIVFADVHFQIEDQRKDYGELRFLMFGRLRNRRVVVAWTPRGRRRRIIMMRYGREKEFAAQKARLD